MIRVILWSAEIEITEEADCEAALTAYHTMTPIEVEGRQCLIRTLDELRMFGGPLVRVTATVEEVRP